MTLWIFVLTFWLKITAKYLNYIHSARIVLFTFWLLWIACLNKMQSYYVHWTCQYESESKAWVGLSNKGAVLKPFETQQVLKICVFLNNNHRFYEHEWMHVCVRSCVPLKKFFQHVRISTLEIHIFNISMENNTGSRN